MPWCATCDAYRAPSALKDSGRCATCGSVADPGGLPTVKLDELPPIPLSLKLLTATFLVYLGWRAWQGVDWVAGRLG